MGGMEDGNEAGGIAGKNRCRLSIQTLDAGQCGLILCELVVVGGSDF
jgi:hypothetical protein